MPTSCDNEGGISLGQAVKPKDLRIILIRGDDWHHIALEQRLARNFSMQLVVVEQFWPRVWRLWKGPSKRAAFWATWHKVRRKITRTDARRRSYFRTSELFAPTLPTIETSSINDPSVVMRISETASDMTIVIGTSILRQRLLGAISTPILNVHGGLLPHYKGNHCVFFAFLREDYERIGVTIHALEPTLDAGPIVASFLPDLDQTDDAEDAYCKGELLAFDGLEKILSTFAVGKTIPLEPQSKGPSPYRNRDRNILAEWTYHWKKWRGVHSSGLSKANP